MTVKSLRRNYVLLLLVFLLLCVIFAVLFFIKPGHISPYDAMFSALIKWPDRSSEHIIIDHDGSFILNGHKTNLVGVTLGFGLSHDFDESYWLPENVARWDKILTYLEHSGVRIVSFEPESIHNFGGKAGEEFERYSAMFDLIYEHKMLVMPHIVARHQPDADDLSTPDFMRSHSRHSDTVGQWASRFADVMTHYPNTVAVVIENELNIPVGGNNYQPEDVANYLSYLKCIINRELNVPVVTNFSGHSEGTTPVRDDIIKAGLDVTDWPCFTIYGDSLELYNTRIKTLTEWLRNNGYPHEGYWIKETNYYSWSPPDASNFTVEYLESLINHGASIVLLYAALSADDPGYSFFDNAGNPIKSMENLSREINRLQLPVE